MPSNFFEVITNNYRLTIYLNKITPQGSILSQKLWNIPVNSIFDLNISNLFADNVPLAISKLFRYFQVLTNHTLNMRKLAAQNKLDLDKTTYTISRKKHKLPKINPFLASRSINYECWLGADIWLLYILPY